MKHQEWKDKKLDRGGRVWRVATHPPLCRFPPVDAEAVEPLLPFCEVFALVFGFSGLFSPLSFEGAEEEPGLLPLFPSSLSFPSFPLSTVEDVTGGGDSVRAELVVGTTIGGSSKVVVKDWPSSPRTVATRPVTSPTTVTTGSRTPSTIGIRSPLFSNC